MENSAPMVLDLLKACLGTVDSAFLGPRVKNKVLSAKSSKIRTY